MIEIEENIDLNYEGEDDEYEDYDEEDPDEDDDRDEDNEDNFWDTENGDIIKFKYIINLKPLAYTIVKKKEDLVIDEDFCSICYDPFVFSNNPDDTIIITKCNHQYHKKCTDTWSNLSDTYNCPTCRTEFEKIKLNLEEKFTYEQIANSIKYDEYDEIFIKCISNSVFNCDGCQISIPHFLHRYHKNNNTDYCIKCYNNNVDNCVSYTLIDKNAEKIDDKSNFKEILKKSTNNLKLHNLSICVNSLTAINKIDIEESQIKNDIYLNCVKLNLYDTIINSNIITQNLNELSLRNLIIPNFNVLTNILTQIDDRITKIYISDIKINSDNYKKSNVIEFNPSHLVNLEELTLNFNDKVFINCNFDLSNLIKLDTLVLNNVKVNNLISDNNLNISSSIKVLNINSALKKTQIVEYLDLSKFINLTELELHNMNIKKIINIPDTIIELKLNFLKLYNISNLPQIATLISLQNNKLKSIPQIGKNITDLNISNNKIEYIDKLPQSLIDFNASHNKLRKIPINENNKLLRTIELENNLIDSIPEYIININMIYNLNLKKNKLEVINIPNNTKIHSLNISNNKIKNIKSLPLKLIELYANKSKLSEFNHKLDNIRILSLNNNNISTFNIDQYKYLESINLANNKLKGDFCLYGTNNISILNIKANKITSLKLDKSSYDEINIDKTDIVNITMDGSIIHVDNLKMGKIKNPCIKIKDNYHENYMIFNTNSPDITFYNLVTND